MEILFNPAELGEEKGKRKERGLFRCRSSTPGGALNPLGSSLEEKKEREDLGLVEVPSPAKGR